MLAVVPAFELGICILTNKSPTIGHSALLNALLDEFLELEPVDWHQEGIDALLKCDENIQTISQDLLDHRNENLDMTFPLDRYAGSYEHQGYGLIVVRFESNELKVNLFGPHEGCLVHWQDNQFQIQEKSLSALPWIGTFQLSENRKTIDSFHIPNLGVFKRLQ